MVVLIIFPVILQTDINVIMLSIGGQGTVVQCRLNIGKVVYHKFIIRKLYLASIYKYTAPKVCLTGVL